MVSSGNYAQNLRLMKVPDLIIKTRVFEKISVLANPAWPMWEDDIQMFLENDWEIIVAPQPNRRDNPAFSQSSTWLSINFLSISPEKVVVEEEETDLKALLEDYGLEVSYSLKNVCFLGLR